MLKKAEVIILSDNKRIKAAEWDAKVEEITDSLVYKLVDDFKKTEFHAAELQDHLKRLDKHDYDETMRSLRIRLSNLGMAIKTLCGKRTGK